MRLSEESGVIAPKLSIPCWYVWNAVSVDESQEEQGQPEGGAVM